MENIRFTCRVRGPSGSGKTSFVIKLLKHADVMFTDIPQSISWQYSEFHKWMLNIHPLIALKDCQI